MMKISRVDLSMKEKIMDSFNRGSNLFREEEILLDLKMLSLKKYYLREISQFHPRTKDKRGYQARVRKDKDFQMTRRQ